MKEARTDIFRLNQANGDIALDSATRLPDASGYLWNRNLLLNINCQGYANSLFMQPEPASYSTGPALAAKTFMQPEHYYYQGHPGRFFFIRDPATNESFSLPFAPMNKTLERFNFTVSRDRVCWLITHCGWQFELTVTLPDIEPIEMWSLRVLNDSPESRNLVIMPCFSIGYQSWMNQGAYYDAERQSVIAHKVSPYQQLADYEKQKDFKELSFLSASQKPQQYCTSLTEFLGLGGWSAPDRLFNNTQVGNETCYEVPVAVLMYEPRFLASESVEYRFIFGAAKTSSEITDLNTKYLSHNAIRNAICASMPPSKSKQTTLELHTPDPEFNHFVNHWLGHQIKYHATANRMTTDPQTRNYLQDVMGMCYIDPDYYETALLRTLAQQSFAGVIPEGVLLNEQAELKYINQVHHSDHAVWLPISLQTYLSECNNYPLLFNQLSYSDSDHSEAVWIHINKAMQTLLDNLDHRGLSYIYEGDWCDPMNMVGPKGIGVSAWLSMATSWAFSIWADILDMTDQSTLATQWRMESDKLNKNINDHFWCGDRYARGITDAGRLFGTDNDLQGKVYLNPQSWSILCSAADEWQAEKITQTVTELLETPYGVTMLNPAYTSMVEDIGRITQKSPGVAENGSIYNHASAFYIYALFKLGNYDQATELLKGLISTSDKADITGQLPNYIPNYYRGAPNQFPGYTGRSSRLLHTGTIAWMMRCISEELCGLRGHPEGLVIQPKLPSFWSSMSAKRRFRDKQITLTITRSDELTDTTIYVNGEQLKGNLLRFSDDVSTYDLAVNMANEVND